MPTEGKNTKKAIAASFKELIQEVPFDSITIKMITDRAGLIRPTFYNHFSDKQEVYEWILESELLDTLEVMLDNRMGAEALKLIFSYFSNNKNIYRELFKITGQNSFEEVLSRQIYRFFVKVIGLNGNQSHGNLLLLTNENIAIYYSIGLVNVLKLWITTDKQDDYSANNVYEAYIFLLKSSLLDMLTNE